MQSSKPTKKIKNPAVAPASEQAAKPRSTESSAAKSTADKSDTVKQQPRKTGLSAPTPAAATHSDTPKQTTHKPVGYDDVAKLAYSFWVARGFQNGSPEEDWLRAERQLKTFAASA